MTIMRAYAILLLVLVSTSVYSQTGGTGSMRDPRSASSQSSSSGSIDPWLAVSGNYDTPLDQTAGTPYPIRRSLNVSGGFSMEKSFRRTVLVLGYSGSGFDYMGHSAGVREGWRSSNVASLGVSSQVTHRLTLDFGETGGAANGGFGSAAAGMQSGGLGLLGSLGVASGYVLGGIAGLGGLSTGLNPLQNGLVDADYYDQMAYFSGTSAGAGFLLSSRSMLNISGSASFIRRDGQSYSDANLFGAQTVFSTQLSRRFSTYFGYSFNKINFVQSVGTTNMQSGFAGIRYVFSAHDQLSLSVSDGYMQSQFVSTVALPPDVAALLGVSTTTTVSNNSRSFLGGAFSYNHTFQRGGFDVTCNSTIAPGNDVIRLARTQGCTVSLSRRLTPRFTVVGIGGFRRLNGLSQSGGRYDVATGGMLFSYRVFKGVSLTAGANYRATEIQPSASSATAVSANAGLMWSPSDGIHLF